MVHKSVNLLFWNAIDGIGLYEGYGLVKKEYVQMLHSLLRYLLILHSNALKFEQHLMLEESFRKYFSKVCI